MTHASYTAGRNYRLIAAVASLNLVVLVYHQARGDWRVEDGSALSALAGLTLVNFAAAVLIRQQNVLNVLFGLAGRGSRSWPLWLRWSVSKVNHIGGVHVGGALAGTAWLFAFTAVAIAARSRWSVGVSPTTVVLASSLVALTGVLVVCAAPAVRSRALLISRAGDWTSEFIDDPPSHVWVRGVPTKAPMAVVEGLFERVVYVVPGSGIGPVLGQILAAAVPGRLVWSVSAASPTWCAWPTRRLAISTPKPPSW